MPKAIDITGQRFGHLVAIECVERSGTVTKWRCSCDCGNETVVRLNHLRNGHTQSCGCSHIKELTGQRFGRLLVTGYTHIESRVMWLCLCECGGEILTRGDRLQSGDTQSCGCLHLDKVTTHGQTRSKIRSTEYIIWTGMLQRCYNSNNKDYKYYGGRGIKVCEGLLKFENFYADYGNKPSPKHSIDRYPNNDGNYSCGHCDECKQNDWPKNCRWATPIEQAQNKRPISEAAMQKLRLSGSNHPLFGRKHSEEAKERMRIAALNRKPKASP